MYRKISSRKQLVRVWQLSLLSLLALAVPVQASTVMVGSVNTSATFDSTATRAGQESCYKTPTGEVAPRYVTSERSYRVPMDGVMTRFFFTQRVAQDATIEIKILRSDGSVIVPPTDFSYPAYKVVQRSGALAVKGVSTGKFELTYGELRIPVLADDLIVLQSLSPNVSCVQANDTPDYLFTNGNPDVGTGKIVLGFGEFFTLNVKPNLRVAIESDENNNGYGDDSQEPTTGEQLPSPPIVNDPAGSVGSVSISGQLSSTDQPKENSPTSSSSENTPPDGSKINPPAPSLPRACRVPKLRGLKVAVAKRKLKRAGCKVGKVVKKGTKKRVRKTVPAAGKQTAQPVKILL